MKNVNTIVNIDVRNLSFKLPTLQCHRLCAHTVELRGVPSDVTDVFVNVYYSTASRFTAFPFSRDDNGYWYAEIPATYFPDAGVSHYELFGSSSSGARVSLGKGDTKIGAFISGEAITPTGGVIAVDEIPDQNGMMHRLVAVNVGTALEPDWSVEIRDTI